MANAPWPSAAVAQLVALVLQGDHSFSQIGATLATTKNAAIGKARRLGLSGPRSAGPRPVSTLAERLAALDVFPGADHCRYPLGDPGALDFSFCAAPAEPERPYCAAHVRACYQGEG